MKTLAIRSDFDFEFSGFRVLYNLGSRVLGFRVCCFGKHVKGYAGFAAGKPRVCSENVHLM